MKTNIFETAKKVNSKKSEKHEIVELPHLEDSLSKLMEINAKIAELEAEKSILDNEIREAGKESLIDVYNKKRKFPGTLKIIAGKLSFLFITSDKYKKIDEERYDELSSKYGENIVEEETVFSFNTAILMKHMQHISDILMSSKKLTDEEKENLIVRETYYSVKKGAINDLFSFKNVNDVAEIIEDIQPIFSVKSVNINE